VAGPMSDRKRERKNKKQFSVIGAKDAAQKVTRAGRGKALTWIKGGWCPGVAGQGGGGHCNVGWVRKSREFWKLISGEDLASTVAGRGHGVGQKLSISRWGFVEGGG